MSVQTYKELVAEAKAKQELISQLASWEGVAQKMCADLVTDFEGIGLTNPHKFRQILEAKVRDDQLFGGQAQFHEGEINGSSKLLTTPVVVGQEKMGAFRVSVCLEGVAIVIHYKHLSPPVYRKRS